MIIFNLIKYIIKGIFGLCYFAFGAGILMSMGQCGVNMARAGGEMVVAKYQHDQRGKDGVIDFNQKKMTKTFAKFRLALDKTYYRARTEREKDLYFKISVTKLNELEENSKKLLSNPSNKYKYEQEELIREFSEGLSNYIEQTDHRGTGKGSAITNDAKEFLAQISTIIRENGEY